MNKTLVDGKHTFEIVDIETGDKTNKPFEDSQIAKDYLMYKMCNN